MKANDFSRKMWNGRLPVCITTICEDLLVRGLPIKVKQVSMEASGRITKHRDYWLIECNKDEVVYRQRWAITSAVYHTIHTKFMEGEVKEIFSYPDSAESKWVADVLMPPYIFCRLFPHANSIQEVAEAFMVSTAASIFQAKRYGLL